MTFSEVENSLYILGLAARKANDDDKGDDDDGDDDNGDDDDDIKTPTTMHIRT